eukprot:9482524-Pyramimonas_sp.AAC.1
MFSSTSRLSWLRRISYGPGLLKTCVCCTSTSSTSVSMNDTFGRGTRMSTRRTTLTDHRNTSGSFSEPVLMRWSTVSQKLYDLRVAVQHGCHHMCTGLARRLYDHGQRELIDRCSCTPTKAWHAARGSSAKAVKDWLMRALPRGAKTAHAWLKRDQGDPLEYFIAPEGVLQLPEEVMAHRIEKWS